MNSREMNNLSVFKKIFQAINDFFDPKYIDATPIPKQENVPDDLTKKVKKTIRESGMFEHAKNYKNIPIVNTIPSIVKLFGDLIKDDEYLQHMLNNLKYLAEDEEFWIKKKPYFDYLLFSSINQPFNSIVEGMPQNLNFFKEYFDFVEEKIKVKELIYNLILYTLPFFHTKF